MDGDIFSRRVRRVWKRVAEAFAGTLDPAQCAQLVEAAMARDLRQHGGMTALGTDTGGALAAPPPERAPIVRAMERKFRAEVVDRIAPLLVGRGRFATYDDVQVFVDKINRIARFDSLAGQLIDRPDGTNVRKPPHRGRPSPASLLNESAPLGERA